jgi:hypothetical protein
MAIIRMRRNFETRIKIEESLRKELDADKVNTTLINPIFGIIRCPNMWARQWDINENF